MGRGRFESRAPCSRRDVAPTGPRRPRPPAPNRSSGDARCRFSAVVTPATPATRRNRRVRFGSRFGESSRTRSRTKRGRTRRTAETRLVRMMRTTDSSNPRKPRARVAASLGGSSSSAPPRRGARRVSRNITSTSAGRGTPLGPVTRGTWSRTCSRDLLFPGTRSRSTAVRALRALRALRGNQSVTLDSTVDSIRGRTPPPSPTGSRPWRGSGPTVGAARVRRCGNCGGVSLWDGASPVRRFTNRASPTRVAACGRRLGATTRRAKMRRFRRAAGSIARRRRARVATWRRRITRHWRSVRRFTRRTVHTRRFTFSSRRTARALERSTRSRRTSPRLPRRRTSRGTSVECSSPPRCSTRSKSTRRVSSRVVVPFRVLGSSAKIFSGRFELRGALRCGSPRSPPTSGTEPRRTCSSSPRASTRARSTRRACASASCARPY
mmetsp:Transcript_7262/g.29450  ORF Transcript_7262/g.29450 Transcript_7262/m.29450 type:complete len:438 (+) Transcript_7262:256-1569(+)